MDWKYIAGIGAGFFAIGIPVMHFMIKSWYEKSKEIQTIKSRNIKKLLDSFSEDIKKVEKIAFSLQERMNDFEKTMIKTQISIENNSSSVSQVVKVMETTLDTAKALSENMDSSVQRHVKTEVVKLKNHLILIKSKRE